jgi:hypothetical protein
LLASLGLKQLQQPRKNNGQKAAEKGVRIKNLIFEQPIFPGANAHFRTPLELHFYLFMQ